MEVTIPRLDNRQCDVNDDGKILGDNIVPPADDVIHVTDPNRGQGQVADRTGSVQIVSEVETCAAITTTTATAAAATTCMSTESPPLSDYLDSQPPPILPPYTPLDASFYWIPSGEDLGRLGLWTPHGPAGDSGPPSPPTVTVTDACCTKGCCLSCLTTVTTFRWTLVTLAALGICCVLIGMVLGIFQISDGPASFLTLSLTFIGLGVVIITAVIIGWRCTPGGHEPCHLLLNLGEHARHSDGHYYTTNPSPWHAGVVYPEFRYRRPPPSYNASVVQQQARPTRHQSSATPTVGRPPSPPPAYRSRQNTIRSARNASFLRLLGMGGASSPSTRPPVYRSHASSQRSRPPLPRIGLDIGIGDLGRGYDNPACDELTNTSSTQRDRCTIDIDTNMKRMNYVEKVVQYLESLLQVQSDHDSNNLDFQPSTCGTQVGLDVAKQPSNVCAVDCEPTTHENSVDTVQNPIENVNNVRHNSTEAVRSATVGKDTHESADLVNNRPGGNDFTVTVLTADQNVTAARTDLLNSVGHTEQGLSYIIQIRLSQSPSLSRVSDPVVPSQQQ